MTTEEKRVITITVKVDAPVDKVWNLWTDPKHIIGWNNASDDWHTPRAENDLRAGGRFLYEWSSKYGWLQDHFGINWQLSLGKMEDIGQKFTPVLMFTGKQNGKAEQAIQFYTTIFEGFGIMGILRYNKDENEVEGAVKHAQFRLGKKVLS